MEMELVRVQQDIDTYAHPECITVGENVGIGMKARLFIL
jgi:hypothetical protein